MSIMFILERSNFKSHVGSLSQSCIVHYFIAHLNPSVLSDARSGQQSEKRKKDNTSIFVYSATAARDGAQMENRPKPLSAACDV